jgi:hypothetical protein
VIERLADLFEPALCDVYARLFSHVIARALPDYDASELLVRYRRIRQVRSFPGGEVNRVFVLSRVTLGADVAVTSVVLAAAKERFPNAEICFLGPEKNAELFAADTGVTPIAIAYGRTGSLRERLLAAEELHVAVDELGSIVIDPDSRLTQLGLIPVGDDAKYYFFESRAFGGELDSGLSALTAEWMNEVFDVPKAQPYVAPPVHTKLADFTVSWGVGENENKRIGDDFELAITSALVGTGRPVLIDSGAGGAEANRVEEIANRLGRPYNLQTHHGSYGSFASQIVRSSLYVGYDSAGQHVAAAAGIPLVSIFSGYACERMLSRWRPRSLRSRVIAAGESAPPALLEQTLSAIAAAEEEL